MATVVVLRHAKLRRQGDPASANRSRISSSAMPVGVAIQVSPAATGMALVKVPVETISPAAARGQTAWRGPIKSAPCTPLAATVSEKLPAREDRLHDLKAERDPFGL